MKLDKQEIYLAWFTVAVIVKVFLQLPAFAQTSISQDPEESPIVDAAPSGPGLPILQSKSISTNGMPLKILSGILPLEGFMPEPIPQGNETEMCLSFALGYSFLSYAAKSGQFPANCSQASRSFQSEGSNFSPYFLHYTAYKLEHGTPGDLSEVVRSETGVKTALRAIDKDGLATLATMASLDFHPTSSAMEEARNVSCLTISEELIYYHNDPYLNRLDLDMIKSEIQNTNLPLLVQLWIDKSYLSVHRHKRVKAFQFTEASSWVPSGSYSDLHFALITGWRTSLGDLSDTVYIEILDSLGDSGYLYMTFESFLGSVNRIYRIKLN